MTTSESSEAKRPGHLEGAPRPSAGRAVAIRLIMSPILLGIVFGVLYAHAELGRPWPTDLLLAVFGAMAGIEMARVLRARAPRLSALHAGAACGLLCGVGLFAAAEESLGLRMELRAAFVALALFALLLRHLRDTRPEAAEEIALGLVPVLFVGLLLSVSRELALGAEGPRRLVWIVLVAKASDMGGWLVGKPFGRHKMIPSVSPGKSWEGTAGGVLASVLVALFLPAALGIAEAEWSFGARLGFGVLIAAGSILAGVFWSGWKRRLGAKDSSSLIPEMGGVMDMVDSLLVAGPLAWLWYRCLAG